MIFQQHKEILPHAQQELWPELAPCPRLGFTLYGGTAIALLLGHRESVDFDFFSNEPLGLAKESSLLEELPFLKKSELIQKSINTRTYQTDSGVRLSFFGEINFGRVDQPLMTEDNVLQVASLKDLLGIKLAVLLMRVEVKDYQDIAAILRSGISLEEGMGAAQSIYAGQFTPLDSLRALTYFHSGDLERLSGEDKKTLVEAAQCFNFSAIPVTPIISYELVNPNLLMKIPMPAHPAHPCDERTENTGMFWESGGVEFNVPQAGSVDDALHIFTKNAATITWNCLSALENNPTTMPQTETILKGQSVSGVAINDLLQVKNYGDGINCLSALLRDRSFSLDIATACKLHSFVGKEDALTWGVIRNSDVTIRGNDVFIPPPSTHLASIAQKGFAYLRDHVADPQERAMLTFLFMSRSQFFHDANKRTASLMMNGVLMSEGFFPITIMNRDSEEFHSRLTNFYNTQNANGMLDFFKKSVRAMYKPETPKTAPIANTNKEDKKKVKPS